MFLSKTPPPTAKDTKMDEELTVDSLIANLKDKDDKVRAVAWQGAGKVGAPAMKPLAVLAQDGALEVSRSAVRAMWAIVRYAGRPGAEAERKATVDALIELFTDSQQPIQLRRDMVWMLSEIIQGGEIQVDGAAQFLADPELREDVRAALQRVPGENSLAALKAGLEAAPEDYKPAIAASLRARGIEVPGVPDVKLKPTRQTSVKPVGR
jgi:HEAT repeat protein